MALLRLEFTFEQTPARIHASSPRPSIVVPLGMTFLSSTWFFSQAPFWSERWGSA